MIDNIKKYIYLSLGLHFLIFIVMIVISNGGNIKQPFVVFGAHSKKDYHTLYKSRNSTVPFLNHSKRKAGITNRSKTKNTQKNNTKNTKKTAKQKTPTKSKDKKLPKGSKNSKAAIREKAEKQKQIKEDKEFEKHLKKVKMEEIKLEKEIKSKAKKEKLEQIRKLEQTQKKELDKKIKLEKQRKAEEKAEREKLEKELQQQEEEIEENTPEATAKSDKAIDEANDEDDSEDIADQVSEEFIFTLSGNVDKEMTEYYKHVQSEVERLWRPPLGVPKGTTCRIKFDIDKDGKVLDFKIVKKSDVLIYDLSILRIAHLFKFHKSLWGKSFVIDFCQ